mgnify:CR=1 FL=1
MEPTNLELYYFILHKCSDDRRVELSRTFRFTYELLGDDSSEAAALSAIETIPEDLLQRFTTLWYDSLEDELLSGGDDDG